MFELLVAHRGASAHAPENTLPAFELAWKQGAEAIEGDFHLTQDGHIVCVHDYETKKIASKNLVIADSTLSELQQLDIGSWKDQKFQNTRIPTLEQVLTTIPDKKKIVIEVKTGSEMVAPLTKALALSGLQSQQIIVIAFSLDFVTTWKKTNPQYETNLLIAFDLKHPHLSPSADETLALLKTSQADGLSTNPHPAVNQEFVQRLQKAGYQHHVWTVNEAEMAQRFFHYGTRTITTDIPEQLRKVLPQ